MVGVSQALWKTLEWAGPQFPPTYIRHRRPLIYGGTESIVLSPRAEEVATLFSLLETKHTQSIFRTNFFRDWQTTFTKKESSVIKDLDKCDFSQIAAHAATRTSPAKLSRADDEERFNHAFVTTLEGVREKKEVKPFKVKATRIHTIPKVQTEYGRVRFGIGPEDVIINIGPDQPAPATSRGTWKQVLHDPFTRWIAKWPCHLGGPARVYYANYYNRTRTKE
jgi:hypothetical protein